MQVAASGEARLSSGIRLLLIAVSLFSFPCFVDVACPGIADDHTTAGRHGLYEIREEARKFVALENASKLTRWEVLDPNLKIVVPRCVVPLKTKWAPKDRGLSSKSVWVICEQTVRDKHGNVAYYPAWNARIPLGGDKVRTVRFSVSQFGEEGAKQRAIAARLQGLAELKGMIIRESCQPQAVSTPDDIVRLEALLRAPQERHDQEVAERHVREQYRAQLAAERLALAQSVKQQALQKTNSSGEPYISRRYNASGKGSWVVGIKRLGKCYTKSFSDAINGGASNALTYAKAWRDEVFSALPVISKAQAVRSIKSRSQSGEAGVYPRYGKSAGKPITAWVAYRPRQAGQAARSKSFSISQYGEKQAFSLAVKARAAFVAELNDVLHLPKHAAQQMLYADQQKKKPLDTQSESLFSRVSRQAILTSGEDVSEII